LRVISEMDALFINLISLDSPPQMVTSPLAHLLTRWPCESFTLNMWFYSFLTSLILFLSKLGK